MKPIPYVPLPLIPLKLPPIQPSQAEVNLKRTLREDAKHGHIWRIANSR